MSDQVISIGKSKEAALYFDRVLPDDSILRHVADDGLSRDLQDQILSGDALSISLHLANLLRIDSRTAEQMLSDMAAIHCLRMIQLTFSRIDIVDPNDIERKEIFLKKLKEKLKSNFSKIEPEFYDINSHINGDIDVKSEILNRISRLGFSNSPTWINEELATENDANTSGDLFLLSISNLNLVDSNSLAWEHICEFRKDAKSMNDLRKLRVFILENYHDRTPSFIADKILDLEYKYSRTAKEWGFKTILKCISVAFDSKSAALGLGSGLSAAFAGTSVSAAAALGVAFPIGMAALEFGKCTIRKSELYSDDPVTYLTRIRDLR